MIFTAGIVSCAVWQTSVIRACAAESTEVVRKLYTWSSIGFLIRFMIPQFLGICALVYLYQNDTTRSMFFTESGALVQDADLTLRALPTFLSQILPAGLIGLIGAGLLAAFMSTHDSYLLCWASVLTHDVIGPVAGGRLSTKAQLAISRLFIFLIGAFLLIWGLWYELGQDLWDYMLVSGAIYFTGAFALLLMGLYWKRASTVGAYLALVSGAFAIVGLTPVKLALGLGTLSGASIGLTTTGLALGLMVLGSLLFPNRTASGEIGEVRS
jgi:SSS family solute:Na+ symporter